MTDTLATVTATAGGDPGLGRSGAAWTVRDATFEVMRRFGMTTIFGNPGSTEVSFLTDLPADIEFVLALHEGSAVGIASGYAIARGEPSFVNLHTAPGLGNAINAIANARDSPRPAGRRRRPAGPPADRVRAVPDRPRARPARRRIPRVDATRRSAPRTSRARSRARTTRRRRPRGPALVVVPMGDWEQPADELAADAPAHVVRGASISSTELDELAELVARAERPAIVVGAGSDSPRAGTRAVALAERLHCPVWQEPFGARAGFPQDHPLFAGHLHWRRRLMREALAPHDLVLVVGTNAFRLYLFEQPEPPVAPGTRVAVITADPAEAHRSPCELAVVAPVAAACAALAEQCGQRDGPAPAPIERPPAPAPPEPGEPLRSAHVLAALAERLPRGRGAGRGVALGQARAPRRIRARAPLGFVSCANGGLGFGISGAIGLRMGLPDRPVVAVLGDGSALFAIQALWSAARYEVGVLMVVMANGGYGVMDAQAQARGGVGPWPAFPGVEIAGIARCFGCAATRVQTHEQLLSALDEALADPAARANRC